MPAWLMDTGPIAAWIAAIASCLALFVNWRNRRDAIRKDAAEKEAGEPWAKMRPAGSDPRRIRVTFHNATDTVFRVTGAHVVRPRGARIQAIQRSPDLGVSAGSPEGALAASIPLDWRVYEAASDPKRGETSGSGELLFELRRRSALSQRLIPSKEISLSIEFSAEAIPPSRSKAMMSAALKVMP